MDEIGNKVVAITGASSGIGEATAVHLAERGAKIVLGARRLDRLEALAARIRKMGGDVVYASTDVTRREDLSNLVARACNQYGRLDVLVNNAGIMPISPLDELRVEDWNAMIDVNIKGVLYGIAAALPVFRKQGSGHIINTASTAALKVVPNMSVYAGTKMAVRAISEGLRQEAGANLRVTVVTPGMTLTEVEIVMQELNRHVEDHTQILFGTSVDGKMGNRLSVTLISSLSTEGPAQPAPIRTAKIPAREKRVEAQMAVEPVSPPPATEYATPAIPEGVEVSLPEQEGRARINQPEAEKEEPITEIAPPLVRKERKAAPAKNPERAPESAPAKPSPAKKDKFVQSRQEVMQFEPVTRGRFEKSEPTIVEGQDLDIPTYLRKNVRVK